MTIAGILERARGLWGKKSMQLDHVAAAMGVVYGDICRQVRNQKEGRPVDETELQKELGNIIVSTIRWCDELGYKPEDCIRLAEQAQRDYVAKYYV